MTYACKRCTEKTVFFVVKNKTFFEIRSDNNRSAFFDTFIIEESLWTFV